MSENHFLDANVIIGSLISWDAQYDRSVRYFTGQGMFRHTSKRVYGECTGVFEGSRRVLLRYLKEFYRRFNTFNDPMTLDPLIERFTQTWSANLYDEKMSRIIGNFVQTHRTDLRNVALGSEQNYGDFQRQIRKAIQYALNELDCRCTDTNPTEIFRYDCCPHDLTPVYPTEYSSLISSLNYAPDVNVLLDSFHIKRTMLQGSVHFVTTDWTHITRNKVV
ncbi:MAG: hypothetical protein Q7V05_00455 [Methanoregula sp.]|nr:hypothetical protein [Methanoregula sp.]